MYAVDILFCCWQASETVSGVTNWTNRKKQNNWKD